jgi:hypothetical protein
VSFAGIDKRIADNSDWRGTMKRISGIALFVFCAAMFIQAQNASTAKQMTGTICDSQCVTHQGNVASCDTACEQKSGMAVFVDDQGKVMNVANQNMCSSHMGKHVKMMAEQVDPPTDPSPMAHEGDWIRIDNF